MKKYVEEKFWERVDNRLVSFILGGMHFEYDEEKTKRMLRNMVSPLLVQLEYFYSIS